MIETTIGIAASVMIVVFIRLAQALCCMRIVAIPVQLPLRAISGISYTKRVNITHLPTKPGRMGNSGLCFKFSGLGF